MKRIQTVCNVAMVSIVLMGLMTIGTAWASNGEGGAGVGASAGLHVSTGGMSDSSAVFYAIAITMGTACLSAAYAVGKVGAAALGAAAEKPELLGKAIVFVGLGEGIAIFGLIISLMLINKI
jgi:V/A-type H+-transporting ATPase subunit K